MKILIPNMRGCCLALATTQLLGIAASALEDATPKLPASRRLVTVPSDLAAGATLNFVGVHGTAAPGAVGSVSSANATSVTVAIASKAPSLSLASVAGSHFVRVEGKSYNISAVSGTGPYTFTVAGNPSSSLVGGYVEVIARPTLNSVFGSTNKFGLDSDNPLDGADSFDIVFASSGGGVAQYKFIGAPVNSWATLAGSASGNLALDADGGFAIQRAAGSAASLIPVAAVGNNDNHVLTLKEGVGFYSWPFPATVTLNGSGLAAALDADDPLNGSDTFDVLILESGGVTTFIKRIGAPVNSWSTTAGAGVPGTTPISAGSCFFLDRRPGAGTTTLAIPVPIKD
jgi:hypothetical protein